MLHPLKSAEPEETARVDRAIREYLAARDQGCPIPDELWLAGYPDLRSRLLGFLESRDRERQLLATTAADTSCAVPEPLRSFGDFELTRILGQGGMGVVYQAHQISLNRPVALKMILAGELASDDKIRRFQNEAEAVARLDHPHLLTIFEVGESEGRRFFTMPLVRGGSLAERIASYQDDPRLAARLVIAVAEGIDHAHRRGILHRDLKPGNILIDEVGRPLVSDFGLAKRLDDGELSASGVLGTPAYMAPEQALGRSGSVTTSCDIYGLGAILYALLTGHAPFVAGSAVEILRRVCEEDPANPAQLNRRVDRRLAAICLRCLAKDPKRRYATAGALADDLRRWDRGEPVQARPVRPWTRLGLWCRRRPVPAALSVLLGTAVVAGVVGVAWQWRQTEHQRQVAATTDRFLRVAFLGDGDLFNFTTRVPSVDVRGLDYAESQIGDLFRDLPEVEADIRAALGNAYRGIGQPEKAHAQLSRALGLFEAQARPDTESLLTTRRDVAALLIAQKTGPEGLDLAQQVAAEQATRLSPTNPAAIRARSTHAQGLLAAGQPGPAEAIFAEILAQLDSTNDTKGEIRLTTTGDLALALKASGQFDRAETHFRTCLQQAESLKLPDEHLLVRHNLNAFAGFLIERNRAAEAGPLLRRAVRSLPPESVGESHEALMIQANYAALKLQEPGPPGDEARLTAARAVRGWERLVEPSHPELLNARSTLAEANMQQGRWLDALDQYQRIARDRPQGAAITPTVEVFEASKQADALVELGRPIEARDLLDPVIERERSRFAAAGAGALAPAIASRKRLGLALTSRGTAWLAIGYVEGAIVDLAEARDHRIAAQPRGDRRLAWTESLLGEALSVQGRPNAAEALLTQSCATLLASDASERQRVAARRRLHNFYLSLGRPDAAARFQPTGRNGG